MRGGGGHLQVEAEGGVDGRGHSNVKDLQKQPQKQQQQHQQQQQPRPVFLSSRDVIPRAGGASVKVGGSARDVRAASTEQFEVGWQQQQQQHGMRSSIAADGDSAPPPRTRSKVRITFVLSNSHIVEINYQNFIPVILFHSIAINSYFLFYFQTCIPNPNAQPFACSPCFTKRRNVRGKFPTCTKTAAC
jgi:hypothetical protein